MEAYITADHDEATSETVLAAIYRAVPDAAHEEISEVIKQRLKDLGKEAAFVEEVLDHPGVDLPSSGYLEKFFDTSGKPKGQSNYDSNHWSEVSAAIIEVRFGFAVLRNRQFEKAPSSFLRSFLPH
jgi:hypothetical protein